MSVDLTKDTSLQIDISDALSEQEKVKFTVHTKVINQIMIDLLRDFLCDFYPFTLDYAESFQES